MKNPFGERVKNYRAMITDTSIGGEFAEFNTVDQARYTAIAINNHDALVKTLSTVLGCTDDDGNICICDEYYNEAMAILHTAQGESNE